MESWPSPWILSTSDKPGGLGRRDQCAVWSPALGPAPLGKEEKMRTKEPKYYPGQDKEMILDSAEWPQWPILPLKRYSSDGGWWDCALLVDAQILPDQLEMGIVVWKLNLFQLPRDLRQMRDMPYQLYPTVEDVLADGWIVD
jgi:hypothetical protein